MAQNKRYKRMAKRMKSKCSALGCRRCEFDYDLECGWGSCDFVFHVNGDKLPKELSLRAIEKSLKGLTFEKALKVICDD